MDSTAYLNDVIPKLKSGRPPVDCWIVYKTKPVDQVIGPPLAIFRTEKALRKQFARIADNLDSRWGILLGAYWFDD